MTATLRLRSVQTTVVEVPLRYVLGTSVAALHKAPLLLVDAHTEEGVTGHAYIFCYRRSGAHAAAVVLEDAAELVGGQPIAPPAMATLLERRMALMGVTGVTRMALSALDMALWDALAVAANVPLSTLLGASPRPLPAYNSCGLGLMVPTAAADEAHKLLEGGFTALKLRLGHATLAEDLAVTRAVRQSLPASVLLMTDYNQALSREDAIERGRVLQDEGVYWLEEPTRHDDIAANAAIAQALDLPLQIGENFNSALVMSQNLAARACDFVMPDIARIGGVTGWMQAAGVAAAHGVPISSHLMPEVSAQVLCASSTCGWLEYVDWADVLLQEPLRIEHGMAHTSQRPGSGIRWIDDAVKHHRID
jgi:mandelate racemase